MNFVKTIFLFVFMMSCSYSFAQERTTVASSPETVNPLKTGQSIPEVNVKNKGGDLVSLNSLVSEKPTILIFYRGGWCPYCNVHLSKLQEIESELLALGFQIIAVSADSPEMLSETLDKNELRFSLYSDNESAASTAFGLAFRVSDDYMEKLASYNIDLESATGNKDHILPVPAVYMLNTSGLIEFDYSNPDYKVRLDTGELLNQAKTLQSGQK
ncbi:MAG TPA: peroxiredoxin-like family protein [Ignavibacteria bacterium]|nr:peroxiredoxin-like family protein [Ignavibacteria bacterium]HMR41283.1 peroxiredoxin-like family protein [Ignavibacteria bacterium]